jgi:hypothetical protein
VHAVAASAASAWTPAALLFRRDPPSAAYVTEHADWHIPHRHRRTAPIKAWTAPGRGREDDDERRPGGGAHLQRQWLQRQSLVAAAKERRRSAMDESQAAASHAHGGGRGEEEAASMQPAAVPSASVPVHLRLSRTHTVASTASVAPPSAARPAPQRLLASRSPMRRTQSAAATSHRAVNRAARAGEAPPLPPWLNTKVRRAHSRRAMPEQQLLSEGSCHRTAPSPTIASPAPGQPWPLHGVGEGEGHGSWQQQQQQAQAPRPEARLDVIDGEAARSYTPNAIQSPAQLVDLEADGANATGMSAAAMNA